MATDGRIDAAHRVRELVGTVLRDAPYERLPYTNFFQYPPLEPVGDGLRISSRPRQEPNLPPRPAEVNPRMSVDSTRIHYRQFHNIFLYVTERCQLRCKHCYMGQRLERGLRMHRTEALGVIDRCRALGARYITFLGGEPTLHGDLPAFVSHANAVGYDQVMLDTNALLLDRLLRIPPGELHYLSVSIDGASARTHDAMRGAGMFERAMDNAEVLADKGYRLRANFTVTSSNVDEIEDFLALAEQTGFLLVNFHVFSEEGCGVDNPGLALAPEEWIAVCDQLRAVSPRYSVGVWYPPTWSRPEELPHLATKGFRGCLGASLDRLSVFPDGRAYVCSVLFDEARHFGTLTSAGLELNLEPENEFNLFLSAHFGATRPERSGCPAEQILESHGKKPTPPHLTGVCRCWKTNA